MEMLFSVVIPTYNRADLIMETLDNVFSQTYKRYEILVVDNCSTDNTEALLSPLIDKGRIRYFRHDRNYERSKSRNTGMQNANGDFLTFLDSDDFMYEDCLRDAAEYVHQHPEIKFFHNLYELVSNKKEKLYQYQFPPLTNQYKALASGNFISCIGGFIHKEIYKVHRFNENPKMIGSEDYEVWFEIMAKYKLGRINKINSGIREHPDRSVNLGVYKNLAYQKKEILNKIKTNKLLYEKFGPYLPRLKASFLLQEAIELRKVKGRGQGFNRLLAAFVSDISVLKTKRAYSVIYNIIK